MPNFALLANAASIKMAASTTRALTMNIEAALQNRTKVEEFRRKHRIGLLTLLFTDLVGSTKLKQELGDQQGVSLIQQHHTLGREILNDFSEAEEIDTAGDSFFIVFAKPSDAARFSLMLQHRLRALAADSPRKLVDRIGIHIGEVVIEEHADSSKQKDLYGLQVDICARVMSLAEGDQILMTRSVFDNARQVLKGQEIEGIVDLSWLNHGPYMLKGVEEPLEICEVGEIRGAILKPPADSEKVHRYVSPDAEPVLGWRPALGQGVPGTSWVLEEKLGEGGFGEVWLGRHKTTKDRRVFKFCFRADRVRSLKREMTLFRLLKERVGEHPNIVRLHEIFFDEPPFYLGMEHVPGRDLKSWSDERGGIEAIPLETRLEIVAQVAEALQAAHEAGVIHRDVKPSNILISESSVAMGEKSDIGSLKSDISQTATRNPHSVKARLTDFGIGQVVSEEVLAGMTRPGFTETMMFAERGVQIGTYLYMAPELLAGKQASPQSDLYSLGVVLYQLMIGDWARPVTVDWAHHIENADVLDELARCFAGSSKDRYDSAGDLARSLRSIKKKKSEPAQGTSEIAPAVTPSQVALYGFGLLLVIGGLWSQVFAIFTAAVGDLFSGTLNAAVGFEFLLAGGLAIYAAEMRYHGGWRSLIGGLLVACGGWALLPRLLIQGGGGEAVYWATWVLLGVPLLFRGHKHHLSQKSFAVGDPFLNRKILVFQRHRVEKIEKVWLCCLYTTATILLLMAISALTARILTAHRSSVRIELFFPLFIHCLSSGVLVFWVAKTRYRGGIQSILGGFLLWFGTLVVLCQLALLSRTSDPSLIISYVGGSIFMVTGVTLLRSGNKRHRLNTNSQDQKRLV